MNKYITLIKKYKTEIIIILILIIISICIYYFYTKNNYEGFFTTTEPSTTEPSTTEPSTTEPSTTEPSTTQPPIDCVGDYEDLGVCVANNPNLNCGPGTQQQEYRISQPAENGGSECPVVKNTTRSISCNLNPCPIDCEGSFGEYETCSVGCGGGTQSRTYTITKGEQHEGLECPHQDGDTEERQCNTDPCSIHCDGDFEKLGECSRECGGGVLRQFYDITTEAQNGGNQCDHKQNDLKIPLEPCNTQPCPTYPENTTLQEALKESNNKIQNIRYNIIDRQEELDTLTNKFNILNKNISFLKHNKNYVPDDKTLTFY